MKTKKIIAVLLAVVLCLTAHSSAFALVLNIPTQEEINSINEVNIAKYAESFIGEIYPRLQLESGNVITLYNENEDISGYCINIVNKNIPNGYVIVKFSQNQPVVSEFCIETNVKNPYEQIIDKTNLSREKLLFYSIGPNEYHVYDKQNEIVCGMDNRVVSSDKFNEYKINARRKKNQITANIENSCKTLNYDKDNSVVAYSSLDGRTVISDRYTGTVESNDTVTYAYYLNYYCDDDVYANNNVYACGVVALCNMMRYYRMMGFDKIESNFKTLYSKMWTLAGTTSSGGTVAAKMAKAAQTYLKELGYNCSYNSFLLNLYSDYKKAIEKDKLCTFSYGAIFDGEENAHAVLVMGYVETTAYKYLQVADGWNSYLRYINYNGYDYSAKVGHSYTVS